MRLNPSFEPKYSNFREYVYHPIHFQEQFSLSIGSEMSEIRQREDNWARFAKSYTQSTSMFDSTDCHTMLVSSIPIFDEQRYLPAITWSMAILLSMWTLNMAQNTTSIRLER